jgi:DNA-binding beta-propeller fold protein YncE
MVQHLLIGARAKSIHSSSLWIAVLILLLVLPVSAGKREKTLPEKPWPELLLDSGRKLTYQQTFSSERDVRGKPGFWAKVVDVVAGEPNFREMVRPYSIAVDSRGRIIVTDPAIAALHIFDPTQHKYKMIDRWDKSKDPMIEPLCVAVDAKDNIYVTDAKAGKVFVFDPGGKTRRVFGSIKGGEGFFKRPTGISIDPETQRVYVTDTLRDRVYILDSDGRVIGSFGQHGGGNGEFNLPTEVHVKAGLVAVVDAMNFRVQLFDREGNFQGVIGTSGGPRGLIYRPKGIALDSEGHIYLVEAEHGIVNVFDREGRLLYNFGNGTGFGQFLLPTGLFIDRNDRVYLADSYNHRVQVFQYHALKQAAQGAAQ